MQNTASIDDPKNMQQQLELQLHEQYAINNNATLSSMLTLFVTMLAVLAGYGYVFINSQGECEPGFCMKVGDLYTIHALLLTTLASTLVLAAIAYICIETGYKGRMEQFITYAIRKKYYRTEELLETFPKGYTPFKNEGSWIRPIQSPYDTFFRITIIAAIVINVATIARVLCSACNCGCFSCTAAILVFLLLLSLLVCSIVVIYHLGHCYCKYQNRAKEYEHKMSECDKRNHIAQTLRCDIHVFNVRIQNNINKRKPNRFKGRRHN